MKRSLKRVKLKRSCWILLFGPVFIFLIYRPVLNSYFLAEDYAWWNCVKGKNIFEILRYFITPPSRALAGWYHPLVGLFYWLNVNLFWMKPLGFHLTNLTLHIGVYFLVVALAHFFFEKALSRQRAGWPSLLAGFLFIIFPFHSEAVAWIDGRHDLLTTFFYLLSFYLFLRWNERRKGSLLGFSVGSFFLALAAKEMAVTLPAALMVYLWFSEEGKKGERLKRGLVRTVWHWLVLVFYFFLHAAYVGHFNPFQGAAHLSIVIARPFIFYLFFLSTSLFIFPKESLGLLLATLVGIFYLPAAFTFTEERYLYFPSTMACIFTANLFFLFWSSRLMAKKLVKVAMLLGLLLVSVASTKRLVNRVYDWKKASEIAQRVVNEFKNYSVKVPENSTVYFLNLPDNYYGSYIFRTHTAEAIQYGSGKNFKKIVALPRVLGAENSTIKIVDKKRLVLESEDGYLIFMPEVSRVLPSGERVIETEDYRLLVENPNTLELILKNDYLGKEKVFFFQYQDGGLKIL